MAENAHTLQHHKDGRSNESVQQGDGEELDSESNADASAYRRRYLPQHEEQQGVLEDQRKDRYSQLQQQQPQQQQGSAKTVTGNGDGGIDGETSLKGAARVLTSRKRDQEHVGDSDLPLEQGDELESKRVALSMPRSVASPSASASLAMAARAVKKEQWDVMFERLRWYKEVNGVSAYANVLGGDAAL
jgi:hypothetical protein